MPKIKVKIDTPEAKERWRLIEESSKEIESWTEEEKKEIYYEVLGERYESRS